MISTLFVDRVKHSVFDDWDIKSQPTGWIYGEGKKNFFLALNEACYSPDSAFDWKQGLDIFKYFISDIIRNDMVLHASFSLHNAL